MMLETERKSPIESLIEATDYNDILNNRDLPLFSITKPDNSSGPLASNAPDGGRTEATHPANCMSRTDQ